MWKFGLPAIKIIGSKLRPFKPGVVALGWGVSIASLAFTAITQGVLIPHAFESVPQSIIGLVVLYFVAVFGVSVLAGLVLADIGQALLGFFASYAVGWLLTYLALALPGLVGIIPEAIAEQSALALTATALFPFALLAGLVGALLGAAYNEG